MVNLKVNLIILYNFVCLEHFWTFSLNLFILNGWQADQNLLQHLPVPGTLNEIIGQITRYYLGGDHKTFVRL